MNPPAQRIEQGDSVRFSGAEKQTRPSSPSKMLLFVFTDDDANQHKVDGVRIAAAC